MSKSNYKKTTNSTTAILYDYFDLSGAVNISSYYSETSSTDNTKLKSASSLNSNLKHVNPVGYQINYADIYNLYVPKCYVWFGPMLNNFITVPSITTRIVFLLQAPGGWGANGSSSPNNNGGDGGSGSLCFGYMNISSNQGTNNIALSITGSVFNSGSIASTITFTGGTSVAVNCWSGAAATTTNQGGAGGIAPTFSLPGYINTIDAVAGTNGSDNSRIATVSPYVNYSPTANTEYFPLETGNYGYGGVGGNFGGSGAAGNDGIAAIWFLL